MRFSIILVVAGLRQGETAGLKKPGPRTLDRGLRALPVYVRTHGHADVPRDYVLAGFALGEWLSWRRTKYASGQMDRSEVRILEAVPGWRWRASRNPPPLSEWLRSLRAYIKVHGHSNVPNRYKDPRSGRRLGGWVGQCPAAPGHLVDLARTAAIHSGGSPPVIARHSIVGLRGIYVVATVPRTAVTTACR
jgi:hypothetical protein